MLKKNARKTCIQGKRTDARVNVTVLHLRAMGTKSLRELLVLFILVLKFQNVQTIHMALFPSSQRALRLNLFQIDRKK